MHGERRGGVVHVESAEDGERFTHSQTDAVS